MNRETDQGTASAANGFDGILSPRQISDELVESSVRKAALPALNTLALAVLGGVFVALGGAFFTAVMIGAEPGLGAAKALGGLVFSLGLVLVVVAGAEIFTGNALMLLALWRGALDWRAVLRNWSIVLAGNVLGAAGVVWLMHAGGLLSGAHAAVAVAVAEHKLAVPLDATFARSVLCSLLVCMAVWTSLASRDVASKIVAVTLPVAAFITIGLENSVANIYLIPAGLLSGADGGLGGMAATLAVVIAGNLVGAAIVAGLYLLAFRVPPEASGVQLEARASAIPNARPGMPALATPRAAAKAAAMGENV